MHTTRQLWAVASLATFLTALAVVLARPLLLASSILVCAWMLASQYSFLATLEQTSRSVSLTQSPTRNTIRTNNSMPVTIAVTLEEPSVLHLGVTAGLPTATTASECDNFRTVLEPGTTTRKRTVNVSWPIAGRHRFDATKLTVTDGLFAETLFAGKRPVVMVEPSGLHNIHVGKGNNRVTAAYGEHRSNRQGSGIEPVELREYIPGETATQIDWKATARLDTPHVREYDVKTDRRTLLIVDHRTSLSIGPPKETKLDYLREVALATAKNAHDLNDSIGFLAVGDEGITSHHEPTSTPATHATIRDELLDLEPTTGNRIDPSGRSQSQVAGESSRRDESSPPQSARSRGQSAAGTRPHDWMNQAVFGRPSSYRKPTLPAVRRSVSDLERDDSPFAETLRPFYANQQSYLHRTGEEPLLSAARTMLTPLAGSMWTVIFTDDSSPSELRETVSFVSRNGGGVMVFLAPTVLYESDGLADLETAYNHYLEFEELRRDLARMDRVTALEVAPGDRLSTVLEQGQDRDRQP